MTGLADLVEQACRADVRVAFVPAKCHGTGVELGAREQAIAERLDALTWIRDRMPEVGDEIELHTPGHAGLIDDLASGGRVTEVKNRISLGSGGLELWVDVLPGGWRYRLRSTVLARPHASVARASAAVSRMRDGE